MRSQIPHPFCFVDRSCAPQSSAVCTWLLIASGSFLTVYGFLDYREAHSAQNQIAEEWQNSSPAEQEVPAQPSAAPGKSSDGHASQPRVHTNTVAAGTAVAKLRIPRLDTVLYVVEGTRDRDLKRGPGHLVGTVLPGEDGNCVIAGHRDTHFNVLQNIHNGDEVILERAGRTFKYRVDGTTIVRPTNTSSLKPTNEPVLNLVTCYPFRYVGSAPKRFIVHAELEGSTLQAKR